MDEPAEYLGFARAELLRWRPDDVDVLDRVISESLDHLVPWMPWAAEHNRKQTAEFLARSRQEWKTGQAYNYAITSDGTVIGGCGLMRRIGAGGLEIGYWLHPGWTGQGLATMAAAALVHQAFRLKGIDRIEIHHDEANTASGAVARRLGFTEAGRVKVPEGPTAPGEVGVDVIWRMRGNEWSTASPANAVTGGVPGGSRGARRAASGS